MKLLKINEHERLQIQKEELLLLKELDRICESSQLKYVVGYGTLLGTIRHDGFIPWDDDIDVCMPRKDFEKLKEICKTELAKDMFYQTNESDSEYYYLIDKIRLNNTIFKESFVSRYNIHHGVYIDIFPVDCIPDSSWRRFIQYYSFHFYRTGLMAKYLDLKARTGKKKIIMSVLKVLYTPFSLDYLYKNANRLAKSYSSSSTNMVCCFFSPYRKKDIHSSSMFTEIIRHDFEDIEVNIPKDYDLYLTQIYGNYMTLPKKEDRITRHTITELKL